MIVITLSCGQCPRETTINVDSDRINRSTRLGTILDRAVANGEMKGWVIQQNGTVLDTYCCPTHAQ